MANSLTLIIPCLNEEKNISDAVQSCLEGLNGVVNDFEILIFNDGSTDQTGRVIDALAAKYSQIKCIHSTENRGLGYVHRQGVQIASKEFVMVTCGDNEIAKESLREIFLNVGKKDMVLGYMANPEVRSFKRRLLSKAFVQIVNLLGNQDLRYYTGPNVYRRDDLSMLQVSSNGPAYSAEIILRLIQMGRTYMEVPFRQQPRKYGHSNVVRASAFLSVARTLAKLARLRLTNSDSSHS